MTTVYYTSTTLAVAAGSSKTEGGRPYSETERSTRTPSKRSGGGGGEGLCSDHYEGCTEVSVATDLSDIGDHGEGFKAELLEPKQRCQPANGANRPTVATERGATTCNSKAFGDGSYQRHSFIWIAQTGSIAS